MSVPQILAWTLRALETSLGDLFALPLLLPQMVQSLAYLRFEALAAGINESEDRSAHARIPEFPDVTGDAGHDLVRPLRFEKFANLVRHIDEAVRRHGWHALLECVVSG